MRSILLAFAALIAFAGTMALEAKNANAAVCADGVYRAGCVGYRGAVVVRRPRPVVVRPAPVVVAPVVVPAPVVVAPRVCRTVWVDGVRVRRCY